MFYQLCKKWTKKKENPRWWHIGRKGAEEREEVKGRQINWFWAATQISVVFEPVMLFLRWQKFKESGGPDWVRLWCTKGTRRRKRERINVDLHVVSLGRVCERKKQEGRSQMKSRKKKNSLPLLESVCVCVWLSGVHAYLCACYNFSIWRLINAWSKSYRTANQRQ